MFEEEDDDNVIEQELPEEEITEEEPPKEEDDEKESYSKRVQKRIDKLAYERNVERDKREQLERKIAAQEAEIEAIKQAQSALHEERQTKQVDQQKQDLLNQRKEYLEIGDYDEINRIDDALIDLKLKTRPAPEPVKRESTPEPEAPQAYIPDAMKAWYQSNQWVYDPNQKARLDKADAIYNKVLAEGYDPEDPDTYQEIDKRLKRVVPPPGTGPDRGQITGDDKTSFTAQDKRDMENWGLDPTNAQHRKEWIKQKGGR